MPTHHPIKLTLDPQKVIHPSPDPQHIHIRVGDTMHFSSDHGPVEIAFDPSVFDAPTFVDSVDCLHVIRAGDFQGRCTITLPSGEKISGYAPPSQGVSGRAE